MTLLIGEQATWRGERKATSVETFTTTANLRERLQSRAGLDVGAVFHSAAVSDFSFGKVWLRNSAGELLEVKSGKISTREGTLMAELVPTPKIITGLRELFPRALLVGWEFEVEGGRDGLVRLAERQIAECRTDACVVNGPAYGDGFGLARRASELLHFPAFTGLLEALEAMVRP